MPAPRFLPPAIRPHSLPPHVWFGVSAVFHYLGPSFAVLLFPAIGTLGVAWLRIASAALIFMPFTRPWQVWGRADWQARRLMLALGLSLAAMNTCFYLALERLPMSLVATIEFLGPLAVALYSLRSRRNLLALLLAALGVTVLIDLSWSSDLLGLMWAVLNGAFFVLYIVLGHRVASAGGAQGLRMLGTAMMVALFVLMPVGLNDASVAFSNPQLLLAGIAVGICSSVLPYICDQIAMARLPRASFALLMSLLPAIATVVAAIVLAQIPSQTDLLGILLVMAGVALHRPAKTLT